MINTAWQFRRHTGKSGTIGWPSNCGTSTRLWATKASRPSTTFSKHGVSRTCSPVPLSNGVAWRPGKPLIDFPSTHEIVNGWDALDRVTDRASFLGRVTLGSDQEVIWTSLAVISGDELNGTATVSTSRTRYSFIVGSNLTGRLQYVFHHWGATQDDFFAPGASAEWYGIDQYLYYDLTPDLRVGGRFEWFRDDDGVRLGLSRPSNPNSGSYVGNMYSLSFGVNWRAFDDVMVRPEIRWDWFDGTGLPFNDGADDDQFLVGMDAIWRF